MSSPVITAELVDECRAIFPEFVERVRLFGDPFLYMKTLGEAAQDERELVRLVLFFGAFYDIGAAWSIYMLTDPNTPPDLPFFEEHEKFFKPMKPARRTANTNEKLIRVFNCIYDNMDSLLEFAGHRDVTYDAMKWEVEKRIWSIGEYFSTRMAYGILQIMKPGCDSSKPALTKHTAVGYEMITGEKQSMEGAMALGEKLGIANWELGSLLCDFKTMVDGRHYPGYHSDDNLGQILSSLDREIDCDDLFHAREKLIPEWALGEKGGWGGQLAEAKTHFLRTRTLWNYWRPE